MKQLHPKLKRLLALAAVVIAIELAGIGLDRIRALIVNRIPNEPIPTQKLPADNGYDDLCALDDRIALTRPPLPSGAAPISVWRDYWRGYRAWAARQGVFLPEIERALKKTIVRRWPTYPELQWFPRPSDILYSILQENQKARIKAGDFAGAVKIVEDGALLSKGWPPGDPVSAQDTAYSEMGGLSAGAIRAVPHLTDSQCAEALEILKPYVADQNGIVGAVWDDQRRFYRAYMMQAFRDPKWRSLRGFPDLNFAKSTRADRLHPPRWQTNSEVLRLIEADARNDDPTFRGHRSDIDDRNLVLNIQSDASFAQSLPGTDTHTPRLIRALETQRRRLARGGSLPPDR